MEFNGFLNEHGKLVTGFRGSHTTRKVWYIGSVAVCTFLNDNKIFHKGNSSLACLKML